MDAYQFLKDVVVSRHSGKRAGVFSVCSTHPSVIAATLRNARDQGSVVLLESTSNQVNQFGGYTGMTPARYFQWIRGLEDSLGVPRESVLIGGDHVGPFPWRTETAESAMGKAKVLVQESVKAGYAKIHLDATMRVADDPGDHLRPLDPRTSAERTAELCQAAEAAWQEARRGDRGARAPLYVIGSDVPLPGGTPSEAIAPEVTRVDDLLGTMALCEAAFRQRGLSGAWERVVAVVVQPAVEHGARVVHPYVREKVKALTGALDGLKGVVFEAHATDYQAPNALREMVEDGFGILKVGPSLTAALRESLFLLSHIEEILCAAAGTAPSKVPQALEAAMVQDPRHWRAYYSGDEKELGFARMFGLSDRCRYYWNVPSVQSAVERLKSSIRSA
jgi:D-tagatose-1,6-bisphosphate aldolase subunit GatZ/KbaZ